MGAGVEITGDFGALDTFQKQVAALPDLPRLVALGSVAGLEHLEDGLFAASDDPYGNPWVAAKDGSSPLRDGAGSVEVTAFGDGKIRATALYPYNFHHTGTKQVGRKGARKKIASAIKKGFLSFEAKTRANADGTVTAVKSAATQKKEAAEALSGASGIHDPRRPIVPDDNSGTPQAWEDLLATTAEDLFAKTVTA